MIKLLMKLIDRPMKKFTAHDITLMLTFKNFAKLTISTSDIELILMMNIVTPTLTGGPKYPNKK